MIHRLRNLASDFLGYQSLAQLASDTAELRDGALELSFASVSSVEANMAAALGAVVSRTLDRNNTFSIVDLSPHQQSLLRRNGFITGIGDPGPDSSSSTIVPYSRFGRSEANRFYDYLEEHLPGKGLPEMTNEFSLRFQQSLGEIFVNAQIHSLSELGIFVCGQFFPATQKLDITIADAGISIPGKVSERFNVEVPPIAALRWALVEGHTTKRGTPGGVGLKLLMQFVALNRGKLHIASGRALWEFSAGKGRFSTLGDHFPGTAVTLRVNTSDTRLYGSNPTTVRGTYE
jgi:hypothetical protein